MPLVRSITVSQTAGQTVQSAVTSHIGSASISVTQANSQTAQATTAQARVALGVTQTAGQTTQNTQAVAVAPAVRSISVSQVNALTTQNTQAQTIAQAAAYPRYFPVGAVVVPVGGNVQAATDANAVIRLNDGTYTSVIGRTGKTILGVPGLTNIDLTVQAGANNFRFGGMNVGYDTGVVFPASATKTFNGIIEYIDGQIYAAGANLEDITFWSAYHSQLDFTGTTMNRVHLIRNMSHNSGYQGPNNRYAVQMTGTGTDNILFSINSLEALTGAVWAKNQTRFLLIGQDEETYGNWTFFSYPARTTASLKFEDSVALVMGSGGALHSNLPSLNVLGVSNIIVESSDMQVDASNLLYIQGGTSVTKAAVKSPAMASAMGVTNLSTRPAYSFPPLPVIPPASPELAQFLPANIGTDSYPALQALIDSGATKIPVNGILKLSQSLKVKTNGCYFVGNGMDVSALVPAGAFPAITTQLQSGSPTQLAAGFSMLDMSLHGGTVGVDLTEIGVQFTGGVWAGVAFVGQTIAGVRVIPPTYAIDNSVIEKCLFQDCNTGIYELGDPSATTAGLLTYAYIDKMTVKGCTFIRCVPANLQPARANNLVGFLNNRSISCPAAQFGNSHNYLLLFNNAWSTPPVQTGLNTIQYPVGG